MGVVRVSVWIVWVIAVITIVHNWLFVVMMAGVDWNWKKIIELLRYLKLSEQNLMFLGDLSYHQLHYHFIQPAVKRLSQWTNVHKTYSGTDVYTHNKKVKCSTLKYFFKWTHSAEHYNFKVNPFYIIKMNSFTEKKKSECEICLVVFLIYVFAHFSR